MRPASSISAVFHSRKSIWIPCRGLFRIMQKPCRKQVATKHAEEREREMESCFCRLSSSCSLSPSNSNVPSSEQPANCKKTLFCGHQLDSAWTRDFKSFGVPAWAPAWGPRDPIGRVPRCKASKSSRGISTTQTRYNLGPKSWSGAKPLSASYAELRPKWKNPIASYVMQVMHVILSTTGVSLVQLCQKKKANRQYLHLAG